MATEHDAQPLVSKRTFQGKVEVNYDQARDLINAIRIAGRSLAVNVPGDQ